MEEITKLLKTIQRDVNETKNSVRNSETNLVKKIDEKFNEAQIKIQVLEKTITTQENRLDYLEKQIRSRNIIIFGVEEAERSYEELLKIVLEVFNTKMKINCVNMEIESTRRKGKKGGKPRPIIVTLTTLKRKYEILQNKKLLENYNYYIKEDYPQKVLEKRKLLQEQAKEEREKGNKTYIKYDKLIIIPQNEIHKQDRSRGKRNLSITPPDSQNKQTGKPKEHISSHVQKKNTLSSYWTPKQTSNARQNEPFFSPNPEPTTSFHTSYQE